MEAYEKINKIKDIIGATDIVEELVQYMSTDDLNDFAEHIISAYDIDINY